MGACRRMYEDTVYKACDVMFEWDEYGCRSLSEIYDPDYRDAMDNCEPYNTAASLATELMIADAIFGGDRSDKANLFGVACSAMRGMLEYASDSSPRDMCYDTAELLDQFDVLVDFVSYL